MRLQRKIPLHGKGDALERLSLHADMAALNPKGFRTASEKKDRQRLLVKNRKKDSKNKCRGRHMTRAEKLAAQVGA